MLTNRNKARPDSCVSGIYSKMVAGRFANMCAADEKQQCLQQPVAASLKLVFQQGAQGQVSFKRILTTKQRLCQEMGFKC